ncbi:MAG: YicC family protein [Bacteroidales bacterium]|nr:YicC family protein [Bacteroidales bacterium]MDD4603486.1 YicC family protein [Bacteroidales bacterium]
MIKSMTGYGKAAVEITGRKITIEIKTLNSKQFDLNLKIPGFFRDKELEIRNLLTQKLERGKIDLYITAEATSEQLNYSINHPLALKYYQELKLLKKQMRDHCDLLPLVLKMSDVMQTTHDEMDEKDWKVVAKGIGQAVEQVNEFRQGEGKVLEEDMLKRVQTILQFLDAIEPFEKQRMDEIRARLQNDFSRVSGDFNGSAPDQNRFEQELIFYLEKLDITEEKVRLLKHCQYFLETMSENTSQGKKLGFVTQEMGREINTIGSKASHAEIQKMVIQMKDELEKIKEQLGNIL